MINLTDSTAQEVFDFVYVHLLSQHKKSEDGHCKYRHNSLKCAAGIFISDETYFISMEGRSWEDLTNTNSVPNNHSFLITALQRIHDLTDPSNWKSELAILSKEFSLTVPKISKKTLIFNSLTQEFPSNRFSYTDIIRTSYEISNGPGSFNPKTNRGYYSDSISPGSFHSGPGHLRTPGKDKRYINKSSDGSYYITF